MVVVHQTICTRLKGSNCSCKRAPDAQITVVPNSKTDARHACCNSQNCRGSAAKQSKMAYLIWLSVRLCHLHTQLGHLLRFCFRNLSHSRQSSCRPIKVDSRWCFGACDQVCAKAQTHKIFQFNGCPIVIKQLLKPQHASDGAVFTKKMMSTR